MASDLQSYKVPVFTNINDKPVAPTASAAGNGAHLIQQHNDLIQEVESDLNSLIENFANVSRKVQGNWLVTEESTIVVYGGETVFVKNNQPGLETFYTIYAQEEPDIGTTFSYMSANQSTPIELKTYNDQVLWVNTGSRPTRVYSTAEYVLHTLVYLGDGYNWYQVAGTPLLKTFAPS